MTEEITSAFSLWRQFINSNRDNPNPGLFVFHDLAKKFQVLAIEADLNKVFEVGFILWVRSGFNNKYSGFTRRIF